MGAGDTLTLAPEQLLVQLRLLLFDARAVGAANGRNRIAVIIPCHRVIGADGSLIGYGGGQARKAHLIRLEKASIALRDHSARWTKPAGAGSAGDDGNSPRLPDGLQDSDSLICA